MKNTTKSHHSEMNTRKTDQPHKPKLKKHPSVSMEGLATDKTPKNLTEHHEVTNIKTSLQERLTRQRRRCKITQTHKHRNCTETETDINNSFKFRKKKPTRQTVDLNATPAAETSGSDAASEFADMGKKERQESMSFLFDSMLANSDAQSSFISRSDVTRTDMMSGTTMTSMPWSASTMTSSDRTLGTASHAVSSHAPTSETTDIGSTTHKQRQALPPLSTESKYKTICRCVSTIIVVLGLLFLFLLLGVAIGRLSIKTGLKDQAKDETQTRSPVDVYTDLLEQTTRALLFEKNSMVYNNNRFVISVKLQTNIEWFQHICRFIKGKLVELNDRKQLDGIFKFINNNNMSNESIYIGLVYNKTYGSYVHPSTGRNATFLPWGLNNPKAAIFCAVLYNNNMLSAKCKDDDGNYNRLMCEIAGGGS